MQWVLGQQLKSRAGPVEDGNRLERERVGVKGRGAVIHLLKLFAGDAYDGGNLCAGGAHRDGGEFAVARRAQAVA